MSAPQQSSAFNNQIPPRYTIKNITAAYTVTGADYGAILNFGASVVANYAVTLYPAASLGIGFNVWIWNTATTPSFVITITPNNAETIDGVATLILRQGEGTQIVCDGTNWQTGAKKTMRAYGENVASTGRPIVSGSNAIGIGNGTASGSASLAIGIGSPTASASASTAIGLNSSFLGSQAVSSAGAMALGGSYASGTDSFAAAIANNTSTYGATGANSIAVGYQAIASATNTVSIGRTAYADTSSGVAIGVGAQSSGSNAVAIGANNFAFAQNAVALGSYSKSVIYGKLAFASNSFAAASDGQYGLFSLRVATTSATPAVLVSDFSAATSTNQIILPNNSAYAFNGTIIARQQAAGGSDYAAWEVKGAIIRGANAAATTLGSYNVNVLSKTSGASAWAIALTADTTNGGLAITATGAASINIRWVASIQTSEVTYA